MVNPFEVSEMAKEIGLAVKNNLIVSERYKFARIGDCRLHLNEQSETPYIPLGTFERFSCVNRGSGDISVWAHLTDGQKIELAREDYDPPKKYEGFRFKDGTPVMPSSLSELEAVWFKVFPDFNAKCWKEVTDNHVYVDLSMIEGSGISELSDPVLTRLTCVVQNRLRDFGCINSPPNRELVGHVLNALAEQNQRNRFLDMMRTELWDGQERLKDVFTCVLGGMMDGLCQTDSNRVLEEVSKCWFIGAVARQFKRVQLDIFPIITGLSGIRKSSAVKWIACEEDFHMEVVEIDDKKFVENSMGKLVLEFAELTATRGHTNNFLKAFLSKTCDRVRLPYDRYATNNDRRFVMIGTSNEYEVLTDPTGNRRYFPFEASPERSCVGFGPGGFKTPEAKQYIRQVWAEAYARYMKGEGCELPEDVKELAVKGQESAVVNNPNVDLLKNLLDELYPDEGHSVCKKDLVHLLWANYAVDREEAERAANAWWKMPLPDWGPAKVQRILAKDHEWIKEGSVTQRCKSRIQPPGHKKEFSTKHLGE